MHEYTWQRSSFCSGGGNNCLEVAARGGDIAIRESSEPEAIVSTDRTVLRAFVFAVMDGQFDHLLG
ncbi:DUF397 domain-containing protein [Streptomyces hygroscopicus]|uniref:DUF397 domain-containing protein n=1 Tax=Streptomyces hygroscopicus TaxID=1912 RepID=UPI00363514A3